MELSKTHMLLVAICVMVLAVPLTVTEVDAADSYDIDPTISDAGYVEKQASLFYYAKFVDGGITSSSPSNDSPTKGVGLTMYDKSVFAQLKGLDETKQYILTISEYSSADANDATASVKVNLNLESVNAFIYYSVGEGIAKVYNKGTEIAGAEFTGTFTTTTGNQIFKIVLSDSSNNEIANRTVSDIAHFTHIAYAEILDFDETYGDNDLIQGTAKGYGYVTSKKDQAGYTATALSNFSYGKYVFAVYITNIENAVLKISDGDKTYNVTESEIHLNTTATSAAMSMNGARFGVVRRPMRSETSE